MSERRHHPRLSIAVEVDFGSENNFYSARTRDISVGGLFIESDVPLPIGTRLRVDLKFLQKHLHAEGEVTWVLVGDGEQAVGMGVRFVDLPASASKSIEAFMALREPMDFRMLESDDDESK
jgi:type IV pilus assembly protein PilZ